MRCQPFGSEGAECQFPHCGGTKWHPRRKGNTKLPGIIGWNMIWLANYVFMEKNVVDIFNSFECLGGVNPLLISQLCLYHYAEIFKDNTLGMWSIYHQSDSNIHSTTVKLAHFTKKKFSHPSLGRMG